MIIKIIRKPDDPLCIRVSAGGDHEAGYYCVFRGDPEDAVKVLEAILQAFRDKAPIVQQPD